MQEFRKKYDNYHIDRLNITSEISDLFKQTVSLIIELFQSNENMPKELFEQILIFFHSNNVELQVNAAQFIKEYILKQKSEIKIS